MSLLTPECDARCDEILLYWLLVAAEDDASGRFAVWIAFAILFRLIPLVVVLWCL